MSVSDTGSLVTLNELSVINSFELVHPQSGVWYSSEVDLGVQSSFWGTYHSKESVSHVTNTMKQADTQTILEDIVSQLETAETASKLWTIQEDIPSIKWVTSSVPRIDEFYTTSTPDMMQSEGFESANSTQALLMSENLTKMSGSPSHEEMSAGLYSTNAIPSLAGFTSAKSLPTRSSYFAPIGTATNVEESSEAAVRTTADIVLSHFNEFSTTSILIQNQNSSSLLFKFQVLILTAFLI
eukprot:NODE_257_length_12663_cov_0.723655.p4 type:complete len:240 gc:universal NODE_257_length_12663_cov_0.723655:3744-4463(+)